MEGIHNEKDKSDSIDLKIIFMHFYKKISTKSIWEELDLLKSHVVKTIKNFDKKLKIRNKINRKFLNKRKKLTEVHNEHIERFLKSNKFGLIKASNVKESLLKSNLGLESISHST